jgi:hypothetical protein
MLQDYSAKWGQEAKASTICDDNTPQLKDSQKTL